MWVEATFYSIALVLKPAYTTATLLRFLWVDAYNLLPFIIVLLTYNTNTIPMQYQYLNLNLYLI